MHVGVRAVEVADELGELLREVVGAVHRATAPQRGCGQAVAARRSAEAEIDAAGVQRLEHAELLGHHERRVVGQHHAARAERSVVVPAAR